MPELCVFTSLLDHLDLLAGLLIVLQQLSMHIGLVHVPLQVSREDIGSLPDVQRSRGRALHDENSSGVKHLRLVSLIKVFHQESAGNAIGVLWLVRSHEEHAGAYGDTFDRVAVQSLVEPDELRHEGHVGVGDLAALADERQAVVKGDLLSEDHVAEDHCGRTRDTLHAVNEDSAAVFLGFVHEGDNIVEAVFDVFSDVILQVEAEIFDALIFVIVSAVVSSAVQNVSDSVFFQLIIVLSNQIRPKV